MKNNLVTIVNIYTMIITNRPLQLYVLRHIITITVSVQIIVFTSLSCLWYL